MTRLSILLLFALWSQPAYGQVIIQKEYDPYEPIVVTCQNSSTPTADVQIGWEASSGKVKFIELPGPQGQANAELHVWAQPGEHWIKARVDTLRFRLLKVRIVIDDKDPSKDIIDTVKVAEGFSSTTYIADFTVRGAPPGPAPGPLPTPPVVPTPELQSIVAPVKAVTAAGDVNKALLWATAWSDYRAALLAAPPRTIGEFKAGAKAFTDAVAIKANLQGAFPGFGAAVEAAMVQRFGTEDGPIDAARAAEFVGAIAWACMRS